MNTKLALLLLVFAATTSCSTKKLMFIESESKFNYSKTVEDIQKELQANNWVISHTSNRQDYYAKYGLELNEMLTIDICKPEPSYNVMKNDKNKRITPMAPMRVAIYKKNDGKVYISRMRLKMMKSLTSGIIKKMMKISARDLEAAIAPIIK